MLICNMSFNNALYLFYNSAQWQFEFKSVRWMIARYTLCTSIRTMRKYYFYIVLQNVPSKHFNLSDRLPSCDLGDQPRISSSLHCLYLLSAWPVSVPGEQGQVFNVPVRTKRLYNVSIAGGILIWRFWTYYTLLQNYKLGRFDY